MIDWLVPLDTKKFSPLSFWDHGYKSLKLFSYQVSSVLSASFKRERERERERDIHQGAHVCKAINKIVEICNVICYVSDGRI